MAFNLLSDWRRPMPPLRRSAGEGAFGHAGPADRDGPIVMLANVPFRSVWQRCQQLAVGLAERADVVFVDPNRSVIQSVRRRASHALPDPLPPRLHLFSPPRGLPAARSVGLFNRLNYRLVGPALRRFLRGRGLGTPSAVVATFPDQYDALRYFDGVPLVYDLMDEPRLFLHRSQWPRYARLHEALLRRADLLVVSARVLHDRYHAAARRAVWISNGVREELLTEARTAAPDPGLARFPGPRIGYVGMISHWFDFDAVRAIARAVPGGTVLLVGPTDVRPPDLPGNVVFTGPVPHARLASVLAAFDVGLIPFVRSVAIDAVNPVKLYEYLGAGLPVLASDFEEVCQYRPLVRTYRTAAEAGAGTVELVADPLRQAEAEARRAFAWGHRWRGKAAQFATAIGSAVAAS
jgi:glycosyltransferase involved in cell wall biosynthesis